MKADKLTSVRWAGMMVFVRMVIEPYGMDFHMYAHKNSEDIPEFIQWAMKWNLALSDESHLGHHLSYKQDFAIVSGWSHTFLNMLLRIWQDQNSEAWTVMLFLLPMLPAFLVIGSVLMGRFLPQHPGG